MSMQSVGYDDLKIGDRIEFDNKLEHSFAEITEVVDNDNFIGEKRRYVVRTDQGLKTIVKPSNVIRLMEYGSRYTDELNKLTEELKAYNKQTKCKSSSKPKSTKPIAKRKPNTRKPKKRTKRKNTLSCLRPYRYVLSNDVKINEPICSYRISKGHSDTVRSMSIAVRVHMPKDLKLEIEVNQDGDSCEVYYITKDQRSIEELSYEVVVRINGKWNVDSSLSKMTFADIHKTMCNNGFILTENGYVRMDTNTIKEKLNNGTMATMDLGHFDQNQILNVLESYVQEKRSSKQ